MLLKYSHMFVMAVLVLAIVSPNAFAQKANSGPDQGVVDNKERSNPNRHEAEQSLPPDIYVTEHIGIALHFGAVVFDDSGQRRPLSTFFQNDLPKVFIPVYYGCPSLCTVTLNRFIAAIAELSYTVGKDYEVIALSIDPREQPALALEKKQAYLRETKLAGDGQGWYFLTAPGASIRMLMDQVGFHYRYEPETMEYLHRATLIFVDNQGKVVRYLHGSDSSPTSIRLALIEAGHGKLGSLGERATAKLFEYNTERRRYGPSLIFMIGALVLLSLAVGSFIWIGFRWLRGRAQRAAG